jgi:DNA repair exonuclease SbcCD ATPase subunit
VELQRADTPVLLGGEPLAAGEERRLTGDTELRVGEGVVLRIRPGGGEARAEADRAAAVAADGLDGALRALGIASLEEAERVARRRAELEVRIRPGPTVAPADADPDTLRRQLAQAERRQAELAEELAPLAELQRRMEREEHLPAEREALEQIHRGLQRSWSASGAPLRQLEAELAELGRQLERNRDDHGRIERDLAGVVGELGLRRERRRTLQEGHGEAAVLAAAEAGLRREVEEAEAALARLRGQRAAADGTDGDGELRRLEAGIVTLQEECERLGTDLGAARERCRLLGADDPHAVLDAAGAAAEEAEEELRAIQRRTDAHRLLLELFAEARADLSERYSAPLARAVEEYLAPLLPEGPACDLRFDPGGGFTGLRLRRGGETYPFAELSGGMREQLAAALRLSMADVLRGAHDGCLPLLFDDAFTNSDPARVGVVKAMLRTAVERGLQVILLSCDPSGYEDVAGTVLHLPAGRPVG